MIRPQDTGDVCGYVFALSPAQGRYRRLAPRGCRNTRVRRSAPRTLVSSSITRTSGRRLNEPGIDTEFQQTSCRPSNNYRGYPDSRKSQRGQRMEDCEKARRITPAVRSRVDSAGAQKAQILCHSHKAGGNRRTRDANKALFAAQSAEWHDDEWTGDELHHRLPL